MEKNFLQIQEQEQQNLEEKGNQNHKQENQQPISQKLKLDKMNFKEFYLIAEGKKKEMIASYLAGRQQSTPKIYDYGGGEPNSDERAEAIRNLMRDSGGGAVRKRQKQNLKQAKTAVKQILKKKR